MDKSSLIIMYLNSYVQELHFYNQGKSIVKDLTESRNDLDIALKGHDLVASSK